MQRTLFRVMFPKTRPAVHVGEFLRSQIRRGENPRNPSLGNNRLRSASFGETRLRGFTLVELLVVITIIAILSSLLVIGATAAMRNARRARIKIEIDNISQGIDQYKNEVSGGDYPPNAMVNPSGMADLRGSSAAQLQGGVQSDLVRHFRRVAPRMRGEDGIIACLAGANNPNFTVYDNASQTSGTQLIGGLSPAEALVFWLNGFSDDPKVPITGSGGPAYDKQSGGLNGGAEGRTPVFEFEVARLGPRDNSGNFAGRWIEFPWLNRTYRINLWQYFPPGSNQPLVYLDTSRPLMDVEPVLNTAAPHVHAVKQATTGATAANPIRYANEGKCQILHCGLDDKWGDFGTMSIIDTPVNQLLLFPNGPFTLDLADTLTNFTTDTLEAAQP